MAARTGTAFWTTFALYSLVVALLFAIFFKHKHMRGAALPVGGSLHG